MSPCRVTARGRARQVVTPTVEGLGSPTSLFYDGSLQSLLVGAGRLECWPSNAACSKARTKLAAKETPEEFVDEEEGQEEEEAEEEQQQLAGQAGAEEAASEEKKPGHSHDDQVVTVLHHVTDLGASAPARAL